MKLLKPLIVTLSFCTILAQDIPTKYDIKTGNLSDEERLQMENFQHQGYLQRDLDEQIKEECGDDYHCRNQILSGSDATSDKKFMGMSPSMVKGLSQAYTMIIGASDIGSKLDRNAGGDSSLRQLCSGDDSSCEPTAYQKAEKNLADKKKEFGMTDKDGNPVEDFDSDKLTDSQKDELNKAEKQVDQEKGEDQMEDYCKYVAMGTEVIAMATQKQQQDFILQTPTTQETAQVQMLQKQSRAHGARAKSTNTQVVGWGATTACYTGMMLGPAAPNSATNWLKLGAATLMWRYYEWEKEQHEDAKNKIDKIAAKLKSPGDCNPVSDRDCYCSQRETMNDMKWCLPQIHQRVAKDSYQVTCMDENLKEDLTCSCASNDTCLDKRIKKNLGTFGLPENVVSNMSPFFSMARGTVPNSSEQFGVSGKSGKLFATAKGILRDNADKVKLSSTKLPKGASDAIKFFEDLGVPSKSAKALLAAKQSPEAKKNAARFGSPSRYSYYKRGSTPYRKSNTLTFGGGQGINKKKQVKRNSNEFGNFMNKFKKKGSHKANGNGNVLKFAEQASRSAEITRDKSAGIFDIISRRYIISGRKRLEVE